MQWCSWEIDMRIIDKEEIFLLTLLFLDFKGALQAFIRNETEHSHYDEVDYVYKIPAIPAAFYWNITPEGIDYWSSLDREFIELKGEFK